MSLTLAMLITRTRQLAGDPVYQGNTLSWTEAEVTDALNWAQNRYAEVTKCTYAEADAIAGAGGLIPNPAGHIEVQSVRTADTAPTGPVATMTIPATAAKGTNVSASVPTQAGAIYFWAAAGGTILSGQGTAAAQVQAMNQTGVLQVSIWVFLAGLEASAAAEVTLT